MFLTLKPGTTKQGIEELVKKIEELGFQAHISKGAKRTVIGVFV